MSPCPPAPALPLPAAGGVAWEGTRNFLGRFGSGADVRVFEAVRPISHLPGGTQWTARALHCLLLGHRSHFGFSFLRALLFLPGFLLTSHWTGPLPSRCLKWKPFLLSVEKSSS